MLTLRETLYLDYSAQCSLWQHKERWQQEQQFDGYINSVKSSVCAALQDTQHYSHDTLEKCVFPIASSSQFEHHAAGYPTSIALSGNSFNRVGRKVLYYWSWPNNQRLWRATLPCGVERMKTVINKSSQIIWLAARKSGKKSDKENAPLAVCHQIKAATFSLPFPPASLLFSPSPPLSFTLLSALSNFVSRSLLLSFEKAALNSN